VHGVTFVALKTDGPVHEKARRLATRAGVLAIVVAATFLAWTVLAHFSLPVVVLAAVAAVCLIASVLFNAVNREGRAFAFGAMTIVTAVATLWFALHPFVMPSSTDPANSLTIENASSTDYTLGIMSWAALAIVPLVLAYQGWTYWVFRRRITRAHIEKAAASAH
jgi:cytochrome d ubiquinol oxidase subunit II